MFFAIATIVCMFWQDPFVHEPVFKVSERVPMTEIYSRNRK